MSGPGQAQWGAHASMLVQPRPSLGYTHSSAQTRDLWAKKTHQGGGGRTVPSWVLAP